MTPQSALFTIQTGDRCLALDAADLVCVQAADNYVRLHTATGSWLHRGTMAGLARTLDPALFLRVHRSWIVRIDRVAVIEPWAPGEYSLVLEGGRSLVTGRSYAPQVRAAFGI